MGNKRRILIAEDHTILREGLRMLLTSSSNLEVCGEAKDGLEAVRLTDNLKPDLILMDLSMPRMNGMAAIEAIKKSCPDTKILVLTVHKTEEYILATLKAGADGYVQKDATHRNKDIADYLYISPKTVEKHRANLMGKLNLHSATELTVFAMEKGLLADSQ